MAPLSDHNIVVSYTRDKRTQKFHTTPQRWSERRDDEEAKNEVPQYANASPRLTKKQRSAPDNVPVSV